MLDLNPSPQKGNKRILATVGFLSILLSFLFFFTIYPGQKSEKAFAQGSWYNSSWSYRKTITINPSEISSSTGEAYTNFPVLIDIASDTNLAAFAKSNGNDILFTASDGVTKLNDQIDSYTSSTGKLVAWVNVGSSGLSTTTSTILYMYFGNPSSTNQQNVTGTWNSNYAAVYHFPNGTTLSGNDSTANANNGTVENGTTAGTTGAFAESGGAAFDGNTLGIAIGSSTTLAPTSTITLESWVNETAVPGTYQYQYIMANLGNAGDCAGGTYSSSDSWYLCYANDPFVAPFTNTDLFSVGATNNSTGSYAVYPIALSPGTWYQVVGTYDGTRWNLYLDGVLVATSSVTSIGPQPGTTGAYIGSPNASTASDAWNGNLDEARISNVARSADWIKTEYNNQSNPSAFYSVSPTQTQSGNPQIISFGGNPPFLPGGGGTSTLSWNVLNESSISITPGSLSTSTSSGSILVTVTSTTMYTLTATNASGTVMSTSSITIVTTPPNVPTGLSASAASSSAISLSWTSSTDSVGAVAGYNIYHGLASNSLTFVGTSTTNSYTDNNLSSSTTYYYAVSAYDTVGNTSATSTVASGSTFSAGGTVVDVLNTVATPGALPFGMNLGFLDNYDAGQTLKNLIHGNPGFGAQLYQSIVPCQSSANSFDCNDQPGSYGAYGYDTWPNDWWAGGTYIVLAGPDANSSGTVSNSVTNATCGTGYACGPTDFTVSGPVSAGDWVAFKKTVNNISVPASQNEQYLSPVNGWAPYLLSGTPTTSVDLSDLPPSDPGTQALEINANGTGNSYELEGAFDPGFSEHPTEFIQLNGNYQVHFQAKGLGGTNTVNVTAGRVGSGNYLNQTVNLSTSSWQTYNLDFTASENGTEAGLGYVNFVASDTDMYIDNVSLTQLDGDPTNNSAFNDGTVDAIKALHPGMLRYWDSFGQPADSLDNAIAPQFGRMTTSDSDNFGSGDIQIGLGDFLQLCQTVGADPWYVMPSAWSETEMTDLMQYLGGSSTSTYGAIRAAQGQVAPWTSVFHTIHIEFGNENWNSSGAGGIPDQVAYAQRGNAMFATAKASPYYNSAKFQFVLNSQQINPYDITEDEANATSEDAIDDAAYFGGYVSSTLASDQDALYHQLFGEIYYYSHGTNAGSSLVNVQTASPVPIDIYEENIGIGGTIMASQTASFTPSLGVGLALGDQLLMQQQYLGIKYQNVFNLGDYGLWDEDVDNVNNIRLPGFYAQELADDAIGASDGSVNALNTTEGGDDPMVSTEIDFGVFQGAAPTTTYPEIQSYAFSNHNIVLFNLSTTSTLQVHLTGSDLPSGNVTQLQLTSANITDTNETATTSTVVNIASTTYTNFNSAATITLPAYSMTDYIQGSTSTLPAVNAFTASPSIVASAGSSTLAWNISNASSVTISPISLSTSSLIGTFVVNPTVSTTYTITATDGLSNTATSTVTVTVDATPPTTPTSLVATSTSSSTISLSWASSTDSGGSGFAGYNIFRCTGSSCTPTTLIGNSSGASYGDSGLTASTAYTYAVSAHDGVGNVSATSSVASATTQSGLGDPTAPQSLVAVHGNTQISLNWGMPASNGGTSLTEYLLYDRFTGSSTFALYATTTPSQTNATATSLTNGQSYDFEVLAANSVGTSTPSNIVSSTPYTVPNAPTGISAAAGNAQATISFTIPGSNGGSAITSYTATSNTGGHSASSTGSPIIVTGLTNAQAYTFTVFATNAAGNSASSSVSNSVTPNTAAASISSFTASPSLVMPGVSSTLAWTTSLATTVSINQGIGNESATSTGSVVVAPTSTTIYAITATNGAGSSTAQATVTVDGTPPAVPTGLSANAISQSEIDLSWASSSDNIGVVGYGIYQGLSTSSLVEIATTTNLTYANTGLGAATTYYYAVLAYDGAGNVSAQSSSTSATTQAASSGGGGGGGGGGSLGGGGGGGGGGYIPPVSPVLISASSTTTSTSSSTSTSSLETLLASLETQLNTLIQQAAGKGISTAPITIPVFTRNLSLGDRGEDVIHLQNILIANATGPYAAALKKIRATGYFGSLTQEVLAAYQKSVGITPASGLFGPKTRSYFESIGKATVPELGSTAIIPQIPTSTPAPSLAPSLSLGDKGQSVITLQNILVKDSYLTPGIFMPGTFDPVTQRAVETFQCFSAIVCSGPAYGIVGPRTQQALGL